MQTITEIEQFVIKSGSDHVRTFGGETEGGANIQQVPEEISACIYKILELEHEVKNYLEIGSAAGGSAFLINHFFSPENMVLVDDNKHPKAKFRSEILKGVKRTEIIGNSQGSEVLGKVIGLGVTYDLLLIDGDHSYNGALTDVLNYVQLLKSGGLIMMHDIKGTVKFGVEKVFKEMKVHPSFEFIGEFVAETDPKCGIGLLRKR